MTVPVASGRPRGRLSKLVRLGVVAEMLLAEVRRAPLDQAALRRLRDAHEAVRRDLGDCLPPRLAAELGRLTRPVVGTRRRWGSFGSPRPSWLAGWKG